MTHPDPNDPLIRSILRAYRVKPRHIGIGPSPSTGTPTTGGSAAG